MLHKKRGTYIQRTPPPVPLAITPTFRPCTHTSDDSYMYHLSLVVATATASFLVSPGVLGIGSEYFVVYLSCVYIYVRLIMLSYLLFCDM